MEFRNSLGMLLRRAYSSMHRTYEARLARLGTTAEQFVLLNALAEESGIIQQELVRRVCVRPQHYYRHANPVGGARIDRA